MDNSVRSCFYAVYVQYCTIVDFYHQATPLQVLCRGWMYIAVNLNYLAWLQKHMCNELLVFRTAGHESPEFATSVHGTLMQRSQHFLIEFMSYLTIYLVLVLVHSKMSQYKMERNT